jgi:hypothetical protein
MRSLASPHQRTNHHPPSTQLPHPSSPILTKSTRNTVSIAAPTHIHSPRPLHSSLSPPTHPHQQRGKKKTQPHSGDLNIRSHPCLYTAPKFVELNKVNPHAPCTMSPSRPSSLGAAPTLPLDSPCIPPTDRLTDRRVRPIRYPPSVISNVPSPNRAGHAYPCGDRCCAAWFFLSLYVVCIISPCGPCVGMLHYIPRHTSVGR